MRLIFLLTLLLFNTHGQCAQRRPYRSLAQLPHMVNHVVASADGTTVASSSAWSEGHAVNGQTTNTSSAVVIVSDVATGRVIKTLNLQSVGVGEIALSPTGTLLAMVVPGVPDYGVQLVDVETGKLLRTLTLSPDARLEQRIDNPVFSPDGKVLATATTISERRESGKWIGGAIQLWDVGAGQLQREIKPDKAQEALTRPAFSPDGTSLAWVALSTELIRMTDAQAHCEIRSWNAQTGAPLGSVTLPDRSLELLAFTPQGGLLAAGLANNFHEVQVWNGISGQLLHTLRAKNLDPRVVVLSPDGETLATAGIDSVIRLWNVESGQQQQALWGHGHWINALTFPLGGKALVSAGGDGAVTLWDVALTSPAVEAVREPRLLIGASSSFYCGTFSPDGTLLVTGGSDGVLLWDVKTLSLKRRFSVGGLFEGVVNAMSVTVSSDSQKVAARLSIYEDRGTKSHFEARVWDAQSGQTLGVFPLTEERTAEFSPDCRTLATVAQGNTVRLWHLETGQLVRSWKEDSPIKEVRFSPDGNRLVVATMRGIEWWNPATGKRTEFLAAGEPLALTPQGRLLLSKKSGGAEGVLQVWKSNGNKSFALQLQVNVENDPWQKTSVSADGTVLAASRHLGGDLNGNDMEVRLWDLRTGQLMGRLAEPGVDPHFLALSPDGKTLAAPTGGTMIRLWDISRIRQDIAR